MYLTNPYPYCPAFLDKLVTYFTRTPLNFYLEVWVSMEALRLMVFFVTVMQTRG